MPVGQIRFVEKQKPMNQMLQGPRGIVQRDMNRRARIVYTLAKQQVGRRTGRLKNSISVVQFRRVTGLVWGVGSTYRIALLHHEGSRPHMIYPKKARVLRFKSKGKIVYARSVNHPGTRPNRYLSDQLRKIV